MQVLSVNEVLEEHGLLVPELRALIPDRDNYKALLFQPKGSLTADDSGVRHTDTLLAKSQFSSFLQIALERNAELAVTPEYSLPWCVLEEFVQNGKIPTVGSLWVLGSESITRTELTAIVERLSGKAKLIFEDCDHSESKFLNPVVYVFRAAQKDNTAVLQTVMLIQFKTCPFGDDQHYEVNRLQRGTRVYCWGGSNSQLRLLTLICSDAFAFTEAHAQKLYDRSLVIHIQLNANPRNSHFREYREHLFKFGGDSTELITLNWAKDITINFGSRGNCWENIGGSGWYLRPTRFDSSDHNLCHNHRKGLYYTWLDLDKCNALFFTYEAAVFLLTATKVAHIGVDATLSRRVGPRMEATYHWDSELRAWNEADQIDDRFSSIVSYAGSAKDDLERLRQTNPIAVERILALCAGATGPAIDWHDVKKLDSCLIDRSEIVQRVTVCHDTDASAEHFRKSRVRACQRVARLISQSPQPALADLAQGYQFEWRAGSPHCNVLTASGRLATVIALDNNHTNDDARRVRDTVAEHMRRSASTTDEYISARQRLCVWFQDDDGVERPCDPYRFVYYDQSPGESPFDIGRPS